MASYWHDTAHGHFEANPLTADETCEVAIIGGGYTGLSAAEALSDRGVDVLLLEAGNIGEGASGRNGGSVTPRYKMGFAELAVTHGNDVTRLLHRILHHGIETVKETVQRYDIQCDLEEPGQVTAAHSGAALAQLQADVNWLQAVGDKTPRILDRRETIDRLGLALYDGAYLDPRGARIHPLNYVRGWALGLTKSGLRIKTASPATAIREEQSEVIIESARGGLVRAKTVLLATDAYLTGLRCAPLSRRLLTVASALLTTAPLPKDALTAVLPGRHVVTDTFALLNYYQILPDGRMLFGGRGKVTNRQDGQNVYQLLERRMHRLFPAIGSTAVTHRWSGLVGLSKDNLPHAVSLSPRVHCAFGYGGRGVVLAHVLGRILCSMAVGDDVTRYGPLAGQPPAAFRFHALTRRLIGVGVRYLTIRDWLEARRSATSAR